MAMNENTYLVATIKPWNVDAFGRYASSLSGQWHLMEKREELTAERLNEISPRYVFLPHWSWKVADEIVETYECICFHMTDLPYGRGGSPLQNLIIRGYKESQVSALRMSDEIDAGPIYMKRPLALRGSAQEIFEVFSNLAWDMIREIVETEPSPVPQQGAPVTFARRKPEESLLPSQGNIELLHDHIRMLDAETYPPAFLDHGEYRLEFTGAELDGEDTLTAKVVIKKSKGLNIGND